MSNKQIKVRVIYKPSYGRRLKLLHVRAELPPRLKPAGKRIFRWHVESKLYKMILELIQNEKLPHPKKGFVDATLVYTLEGSSSSQASLYKPVFSKVEFVELPKYPEGVPEEHVLISKTKLSVKN